jgi:hypothetical protein
MKRLAYKQIARRAALLMIVCAVSAGAVVAIAFGTARIQVKHFSVLRTPRAHVAAIRGLSSTRPVQLYTGPSGTVSLEQRANGDICLTDRLGRLTVFSCSHQAVAEESGLGLSLPAPVTDSNAPEMVAVVPDGVADITVVTEDGTQATVPVTNNFARYSAAGLTKATYSPPNGPVQTIEASPKVTR